MQKIVKENPIKLSLVLAFQFVIICFMLSPLLLFGGNIGSAFSQRADGSIEDPSKAEIPVFDFSTTNKSIVVLLEFTNRTETQLVSANVTLGLAPTHIGDPPLLRVEVFDSSNKSIQEFNAWHPLWNLVYDSDLAGTESLVILPNATGAFIFPFNPNATSMVVTDLTQVGQQLITVDLKPTIQAFCQQHRDDPDCRDVVIGPTTGGNNISNTLAANP